jgi:hypothetical protein
VVLHTNEAKTKGQETEFRSQKAEDGAVAKPRANTPTERRGYTAGYLNAGIAPYVEILQPLAKGF